MQEFPAPLAKAPTQVPRNPSMQMRITGAEMWAGTCPYLVAISSMAPAGCDFHPILFSEKQSDARAYAAVMLPQALDFGAYAPNIVTATESPDFVAVTPECAPYLKCGQQKMQHDPRSEQIMQSAEAIKTWSPKLMILEEAPEFFDNDHVHGLFTEFNNHVGMIPCPIITQRDSEGGGSTIRTRKFACYQSSSMYYSLPPWQLQPSPATPKVPIQDVLDAPDDLTTDLFVPGVYTAYPSPHEKPDGMVVVGTAVVGGCKAGVVPKVLVRWQGSSFRIESINDSFSRPIRMLHQGWGH